VGGRGVEKGRKGEVKDFVTVVKKKRGEASESEARPEEFNTQHRQGRWLRLL